MRDFLWCFYMLCMQYVGMLICLYGYEGMGVRVDDCYIEGDCCYLELREIKLIVCYKCALYRQYKYILLDLHFYFHDRT